MVASDSLIKNTMLKWIDNKSISLFADTTHRTTYGARSVASECQTPENGHEMQSPVSGKSVFTFVLIWKYFCIFTLFVFLQFDRDIYVWLVERVALS